MEKDLILSFFGAGLMMVNTETFSAFVGNGTGQNPDGRKIKMKAYTADPSNTFKPLIADFRQNFVPIITDIGMSNFNRQIENYNVLGLQGAGLGAGLQSFISICDLLLRVGSSEKGTQPDGRTTVWSVLSKYGNRLTSIRNHVCSRPVHNYIRVFVTQVLQHKPTIQNLNLANFNKMKEYYTTMMTNIDSDINVLQLDFSACMSQVYLQGKQDKFKFIALLISLDRAGNHSQMCLFWMVIVSIGEWGENPKNNSMSLTDIYYYEDNILDETKTINKLFTLKKKLLEKITTKNITDLSERCQIINNFLLEERSVEEEEGEGEQKPNGAVKQRVRKQMKDSDREQKDNVPLNNGLIDFVKHFKEKFDVEYDNCLKVRSNRTENKMCLNMRNTLEKRYKELLTNEEKDKDKTRQARTGTTDFVRLFAQLRL